MSGMSRTNTLRRGRRMQYNTHHFSKDVYSHYNKVQGHGSNMAEIVRGLSGLCITKYPYKAVCRQLATAISGLLIIIIK